MSNFFQAIQGKFDARYHGRYLGNIIELVANIHPEILKPITDSAPFKDRPWKPKDIQSVTTESIYSNNGRRQADLEIELRHDEQKRHPKNKARQADLEIELRRDDQYARLLVEIKMFDDFLDGQLKAYIKWAQGSAKKMTNEDRAVFILTAFPLKKKAQELIKNNREKIFHLYLSDLVAKINDESKRSELIQIFSNYLQQEGYAMYQLIPSKSNRKDYDALLSFMVLNFLPHESGHSKVTSAAKISQGPAVFGYLIQNWQIVSDRLAETKLTTSRIPTLRYFPQQQHRKNSVEALFDLSEKNIFEENRSIRKSKDWGRYWMVADSVCDSSINLRIEWGQVIQIQHGKEGKEGNQDYPIECWLYALVRKGPEQLGCKKLLLKNGICHSSLYHPEKFMEELLKLIKLVIEPLKKQYHILPKLD